MAEPVSSSTAAATLGAVGLLALLPGLNAEVVLGAFAGAIVFILSAADLTILRKIGLFGLSFITGILAAGTFASVLDALLPASVNVSPGVGAMIAAAIVIKLLQWFIRRANDPDSLIRDAKDWSNRK